MTSFSSRRTAAAVLASVLAAAALGACGAGEKAGAEGAAAVECDYPMPAEETTVNVLAYNSSAIDPFTNTMVKSCSRDKVTLKHDPIDFAGQVTKTTATLADKEGTYDIIETYGFVTPGQAAAQQIISLDDMYAEFSDKYGLDKISESMREGLSYDGHLYGVPMQAQMFVLAYRKDVFDKLGLKAPTTFAEMRQAAQTIRDKGGIEYPLALPFLASEDISTAYQAAMNSAGGDFLDGSGKPTFDSPASTTALKELISLMPFMDPQVTTFDQPKVQQQMFNGTAAMAIMFSGRMDDLTKTTNTKHAADFAFAAPPAVDAESKYIYSRLSIDGWAIPANTTLDKKMLFEMIASSVSEDASKAAVPAAYPAREGMVSEDSSPFAGAVNSSMAKTMPTPGHPDIAEVTNAIRPVLVKVITGDLSIPEGQRQMQAAAQKVIDAK